MKLILASLLLLFAVSCVSSMSVMSVQAEMQLTQLEACYEAELTAIDGYPAIMHSVAQLTLKAKFDPVFQMYRGYRELVAAGNEDGAKEAFGVFIALASVSTARCMLLIPEPVGSAP